MKQKTHKDCHFCGTEFKLFRTTDKYCSVGCKVADNESTARKKEANKRSPITPVSQKRLNQLADYRKLKKEFMSKEENKICPVTGLPATEIHHKFGRENERLNDVEYWLAVSRAGHQWIHAHPKEARVKGWLI